MIIDVSEIYAQAIMLVFRTYLTEAHMEPEGDTSFSSPAPVEWKDTGRWSFASEDDFFACSFVILQRLKWR